MLFKPFTPQAAQLGIHFLVSLLIREGPDLGDYVFFKVSWKNKKEIKPIIRWDSNPQSPDQWTSVYEKSVAAVIYLIANYLRLNLQLVSFLAN